MALTTEKIFPLLMPLNGAGRLTDAEYIKGGYCVVKDIGSRDALIDVNEDPDGTVVEGSICYVQSHKNEYGETVKGKCYKYNGLSWEETDFGGAVGGGAVDDAEDETPTENLDFVLITEGDFKGTYMVSGIKDPSDTEGLKTKDDYTNVVIPSKHMGDDGVVRDVTVIAGGAFACCSTLKSVKIPNTIKEISERAFLNCTSLQGVEIPDSVKKIGCDYVETDGSIKFSGEVFEGCTSLKWVTIPKSVEIMGYDIFAGCTFDKLTIYCETPTEPPWNKWCHTQDLYWNPLGCRVLYNNRVEQIKDRTTVTHNGLTYSSSKDLLVRFNQEKTACSIIDVGYCTDTDVVIPSTYNGVPIVSIGSRAFQNCHSIARVLFGDNITGIDEYAFYNCTNLTTVELPEGLTSLGYSGAGSVFGNCTKLESVVIPESVKLVGENIFIGCTSAKIYCATDAKPHLWKEDWNPSNCEVVWSAPLGDITLDTILELRLIRIRCKNLETRCSNLETRCSNLETKLNTAINRLWENEKFIYELLFAIAVYEDVSDDVKVWMTKYPDDMPDLYAPDGTPYYKPKDDALYDPANDTEVRKYDDLDDAEKTKVYKKYIDP